ncbi:MAG: cysteine--tRNA ligase [Gammaproteobacteria bacterium]|nr:cysteine--tRNA ligase [Gammaproteobacteria bacterium]
MLQIYNSLTKQKEPFHPIEPGKVQLYVCGLTPYDYTHIGHGRTYAVFDVITRYLRYQGLDVTYVRNFTDIDDKIIQRAQENNEPYQELTARYIGAMREDMAALGILPPDREPLATEYIAQMQSIILVLLDKGYAYVGENGDVYYHVQRFADYGKLAHKTLKDLQAGARVSIVEAKENPLDFVLWKQAKPGEPHWESPWGKGRPGWHIECSAMTQQCLGNHFDIHGGGADLKFPHHENEIAQSEAANDEKFANYWIHTGMVNVNQEKMSKSLGNFFTIREVLNEYRPEVIRYFLISSHYRSPVNYSQESLENATAALTRFYTAMRGVPEVLVPPDSIYEQRFNEAMDDDFNTPVALAVLFDLVHDINRDREQDPTYTAELVAILRRLAGVLGVLQEDPVVFLRGGSDAHSHQNIDDLVAARDEARLNKNWAEADRIRQQLSDLGILIEDTPEGTLWRKGK